MHALEEWRFESPYVLELGALSVPCSIFIDNVQANVAIGKLFKINFDSFHAVLLDIIHVEYKQHSTIF